MALARGARFLSSFTQQRAGRAIGASTSIGWEKMITPFTPESFKRTLSELERGLETQRSDAQRTKLGVDPIDWSHYEKNISAPGVVSKLRKEYEEHKFEEVAAINLSDFNKRMDIMIDLSSKLAKATEPEIVRYKADLAKALQDKKFIETRPMTTEQILDRFPGAREELVAEAEEGEWWYKDAEQKLMAVDVKEVRKALSKGEFPAIGDLFPPDALASIAAEEAKHRKVLEGVISDMRAAGIDVSELAPKAPAPAPAADAHHH